MTINYDWYTTIGTRQHMQHLSLRQLFITNPSRSIGLKKSVFLNLALIFAFKCTLKCRLKFVSFWTSLKFSHLLMGYSAFEMKNKCNIG